LVIEQQINTSRALEEWFQSPLGQFVAQEFIMDLKPLTDYLRGEYFLQLGTCGENPWLDLFRYKYQWIASPYSTKHNNQLVCSLNQLPFSRNSMDCVLVPLGLEPFENAYSLIDEIDRVLHPMGFVIFLCLNPWSLWGGALKCGLLRCFADNKIKMRTALSLNRIFSQRGYRQCSLSNFCYIPPVKSEQLINKFVFLDDVGKMIWPFPSGFYCYIAQKYEYITPNLIAKELVHNVENEYKTPLQPATNFDYLKP